MRSWKGRHPTGVPALSSVMGAKVALLAALLLLAVQPAEARSWTDEKCDRYGQAWAEAVRLRGTGGLTPGFLAANDAFLASRCTERRACPRSADDIAMADLMTIAAVNARISGTFLPFVCRP